MLEAIPYEKGRHAATPDSVTVPEWGLDLAVSDGGREITSVTWTYADGRLFVGLNAILHPSMRFGGGNGIDGRLWTREKVCAFWWCGDIPQDRFLEEVGRVSELFGAADYYPVGARRSTYELGRLDLSDYTFVFLGYAGGVMSVIRCDLRGLMEGRFVLLNCSDYRSFWQGGLRGRKNKGAAGPYQEECRYWKGRIGSMDIAQWHLLTYEE